MVYIEKIAILVYCLKCQDQKYHKVIHSKKNKYTLLCRDCSKRWSMGSGGTIWVPVKWTYWTYCDEWKN